eukprot:490254-Rhodomonas_salina.1
MLALRVTCDGIRGHMMGFRGHEVTRSSSVRSRGTDSEVKHMSAAPLYVACLRPCEGADLECDAALLALLAVLLLSDPPLLPSSFRSSLHALPGGMEGEQERS